MSKAIDVFFNYIRKTKYKICENMKQWKIQNGKYDHYVKMKIMLNNCRQLSICLFSYLPEQSKAYNIKQMIY